MLRYSVYTLLKHQGHPDQSVHDPTKHSGFSPSPTGKLRFDQSFTVKSGDIKAITAASQWANSYIKAHQAQGMTGANVVREKQANGDIDWFLEYVEKQSFIPPQSVRDAAKRGLELRRKYGRGGLTNAEASDQGIGSGVQRAVNLSNGDAVSLDTVKRMKAFFARHEKNKNTPPEKGNGMIAWLLWGSDAGKAWADGIVKDSLREKVAKAVQNEN